MQILEPDVELVVNCDEQTFQLLTDAFAEWMSEEDDQAFRNL
jgi:hypothetical protein